MCMYTSQHAQAHVRICVHSLVYITNTAYIARNVHHLLFGSRDQHGFTPMHHAAINGHGSVIDVFINRAARLDIVNMGGDTLLHVAAAHGKYDIVQKVLYVHTCVHACVHGVKYDCVVMFFGTHQQCKILRCMVRCACVYVNVFILIKGTFISFWLVC